MAMVSDLPDCPTPLKMNTSDVGVDIDIYHFLFDNHPSKVVTMIAGIAIIIVDIVLFLGIIWGQCYKTFYACKFECCQ
jgi:hypothetical protein